ncbi:MAG: transcription termination/antitermination NusG family protein [Chloroflexota bacterium]
MSTASWYVIHSKPRKENQVNAYLRTQGFETFYPTLRVQPVNPRASRIRPYFPRYLFVHADLDEVGVSALQWVPGAIGLVEFDGYVAPVPDSAVHELTRRVAAIEAAGGLTFDGLQPGDPVRITHGPFAGYEAIFDMRLGGSERVQVLLQMLGRLVKVRVNAGAIEKRRVRG